MRIFSNVLLILLALIWSFFSEFVLIVGAFSPSREPRILTVYDFTILLPGTTANYLYNVIKNQLHLTGNYSILIPIFSVVIAISILFGLKSLITKLFGKNKKN